MFGGDFRQVLPVIFGAHRATIIDAGLKSYGLWNRLTKLQLTNNLRKKRAHVAAEIDDSGGDVGNGDGRENDGREDDGRRQTRVLRHEALGYRTYGRWLLELGEGRLPYAVVPRAATEVLPTDLILILQIFLCPSLEALSRFVFGDGNYGAANVGDKEILCPTNMMVDTVNDHIFDLLGGESKTYFSKGAKITSEDDQERLEVTEDFLNDMNVPGLL